MAQYGSTEMPLGTTAPEFTLVDTRTDQPVSMNDFAGQPVMVIFMCNHCPYVVHILSTLVSLASEAKARGVATVAISANDIHSHPADAPEHMARLATDRAFGFPYCFDETQAVARAYGAVCTPDPFLFDAEHRLYYHGQLDGTRPGHGESTGTDMRAAITQLLAGQDPPEPQHPSVGCSIKWSGR